MRFLVASRLCSVLYVCPCDRIASTKVAIPAGSALSAVILLEGAEVEVKVAGAVKKVFMA